jgi:hypothetical protein
VTEDWTVPAWTVVSALGALLLLGILLLVALARTRGRAETLQSQVDAIERRLAAPEPAAPPAPAAAPARPEPEFVITHLGVETRPGAGADAVPTVAAPLFADLVLRESVVQAASLAAGLRRALAPQMRNKIRFEMRREVKRARKQRRADLREARRAQRVDQPSGADAA